MKPPKKISRRQFHGTTAAATAAIALTSATAQAKDDNTALMAGAAEATVPLPAVGTFLIGPMGKSTGIHDDLFIRALVLSDGDDRVAILTSDMLGFDFEYNDQIVNAVSKRTGIPTDRIMHNASHNHSSPLTIPWSDQWEKKKDKPWHKTLPGLFADITEKAINQLEEVTIRYCREPTQISVNRRIEANHGMTMAPNPQGDSIDWTDILYLKNKKDEPVGVLYSYAAHPVIVHGDSDEITADYPGFARNYILNATKKRGVVMFAQGCSADINGFPLRGGLKAAAAAGRDLGYAVIRGLQRDTKEYVQGKIRVVNHHLQLPLQDPPSVEDCEKALARRPQSVAHQELLAIAKAGKPRFLPQHLQVFALGKDLCILGMAHEMFATYQLFAEEVSPFKHTLVFSYTNGCESYVADKEGYDMGHRGGYEASPGGAAMLYPHRLACKPSIEKQIKDDIVKILQEAMPS